ncbi:hypothetical protein V1511DRAFT_464412 [Dipodascopsis uninucleata]
MVEATEDRNRDRSQSPPLSRVGYSPEASWREIENTNRRPRGILKNPPPAELYGKEAPRIDRSLVLENTRLNAQRHSNRRSTPEDTDREDKESNLTDGGQNDVSISENGVHVNGEENKHVDSDSNGDASDNSAGNRLKWDEANIYLTEQERTATMKITEPKTPFARSVDMDDLNWDSDEDDMPGLDLGEPEEPVTEVETEPHSEIIVAPEPIVEFNADSDLNNGCEDDKESDETEEERHRRFQEMRKRHYEMKDALKLAHQLAETDDEEE